MLVIESFIAVMHAKFFLPEADVLAHPRSNAAGILFHYPAGGIKLLNDNWHVQLQLCLVRECPVYPKG
jgi:hypothetical protein